MTKKGRIKVLKDGPCLVTGGIPMSRMAIEADRDGYPCRWQKAERAPESHPCARLLIISVGKIF